MQRLADGAVPWPDVLSFRVSTRAQGIVLSVIIYNVLVSTLVEFPLAVAIGYRCVQETRRQGAERERARLTQDGITRRAPLPLDDHCRKRVFLMSLFCTAAG